MKKAFTVLITIIVETSLLWVLSLLFGWKLIDILFLGGLAIFGGIWLFFFSTNQASNTLSAGVRGWAGQDAGEIKLFKFEMSPVILGIMLFTAISFIVTIFYYSSYMF